MKQQKSSKSSTEQQKWTRYKSQKIFGISYENLYFWFSLILLTVTTVYWTVLGARYHLSNADQLVNSMLFANLEDIRNALLPNAHSFLIKWPLFLIGGIFDAKSTVLIALTILVSLATVLPLAYILYRIEKRRIVIATIYTIMASMLLLTPIAPRAWSLLPVSMAMLATRNIEYIVYIWALYWLIKSNHIWRSKAYLIGIFLLTALFASDKLFVSLSLGGALGMISIYAIARKWRLMNFGFYWLIATSIATVSAILSLWLINLLRITNIVSGGSGLGPYGMIHTSREFIHGVIYAILGVLSNFGANPAYDATKFKDIPESLKTHLLSFGFFGYIINLAFLSIGVYLSILLVRATLVAKTPSHKPLPFGPLLSIMLLSSSATSLAIFIFSKHYYPVDARYLAIWFFAILISATTYTKAANPNPKKLLVIGIVTSLTITMSLLAVAQTSTMNTEPLQMYSNRNAAVVQALKNRHVEYLVGDYWRVVPIGQQSNNTPTISPLSSCTQYREVLTSTAWQPNLKNSSFAYLLSMQKGLTNFPTCSLDDVTKEFGKPSSSTIIDGTVEEPKELLLFFDNGKKSSTEAQSSNVVPISIEKIIPPSCPNTQLNIVAHQDDDLLFMNPDVQNAINEGVCTRTIFLTAGDSGNNSFYWLGREKGTEAAYSQMSNVSVDQWVQRNIKINDTAYVTMASPKSNLGITLVYFRLPDGGLEGQGFETSNHTSLEKLYTDQIKYINTIDGQSTYNKEQLISALIKLIDFYKPNLIRTQSTANGITINDHADHITTSNVAKLAYEKYLADNPENSSIAIRQYSGYPTREAPQNISKSELDDKMTTFLTYAQNDGAVCRSQNECLSTETYIGYLERQYYN